MLCIYNGSSWWWAQYGSKHVEENKKNIIINECINLEHEIKPSVLFKAVRQCLLQDTHRDMIWGLAVATVHRRHTNTHTHSHTHKQRRKVQIQEMGGKAVLLEQEMSVGVVITVLRQPELLQYVNVGWRWSVTLQIMWQQDPRNFVGLWLCYCR